MKKSFLVFATVLLSLFVSCASSAKFDLKKSEPVALISVSSNGNLPWKEVESANGTEETSDSAGLISSFMAKNDSNNPEFSSLYSRIDYAADAFERLLCDAGVLTLNHSKVASLSSYEALLASSFNMGSTDICADGYLKSKPNLDKSRKILNESGAKSLVCTSFVFKKEKIKLGAFERGVKAYVKMTVSIIGESGHVELKKVYECTSDEYLPYNNGNWDKKVVVDLFPSTIEKAIKLFINDYVSESAVVAEENSEEFNNVNEGNEISSDEYVYEGEATIISLPMMGEKRTSE